MARTHADIIDEVAGGPPPNLEEEPAPEPEPTPEPKAKPLPGPEPAAKGTEPASELGEPSSEPAPEPAKPTADPTVPIGALHEARAANKELKAEIAATGDKITRMEALFERFQTEAKAPQADGLPDYEEDPVGHLHGKIEALQDKLDGFEKRDTEGRDLTQAKDTADARENALLERYAASIRTFTASTPDFQVAYDFLAKTIDADLIARGYDDPVERSNVIQYEEGNEREIFHLVLTERGWRID